VIDDFVYRAYHCGRTPDELVRNFVLEIRRMASTTKLHSCVFGSGWPKSIKAKAVSYAMTKRQTTTLDRNRDMQRLQDIVGKLYRAPSGHTRQVFGLSRSDAERLPRLPSIAVISITAPERPPADLDGFNHLLRLSFADVDFLNPDLSERAKTRVAHSFTAEQACMIRSFIERLPDTVASVVVHCEGGYSRSCAIALGLHRLYGYSVEMKHLVKANPSVVRVLMGDSHCP
jgi:predicted protein tyrosine phosphatase